MVSVGVGDSMTMVELILRILIMMKGPFEGFGFIVLAGDG